tara:strand:+ start:8738 stop:9475 length:738 start_codon:yes stop_codon:yes gene_type:complete
MPINKNIKEVVNEKITPLLLIKEKYDSFDVKNLIDEINEKTLFIITEIKDNYSLKKKEIDLLESEISILLSNLLYFQVETNNNFYLDDYVDYIIEIIQININEFYKTKKESLDLKILFGLNYSLMEIYNFHDLLYFGDYLNFNKIKDFNNNFTKSLLNINYQIINHLKKNENNDIHYVYSNLKLIDKIYSDTLKVLFENLSSNEEKIKKYINKHNRYINTTEEVFIEKYSTVINFNEKIYKKIIK